ncbi:MAG: type I methionyl aminopeptidase [Chloroflexi bacterium]|nr:type I methionyl aminopeptidase [Chloroflexota bacterium]MDA1173494.1 type I methionyl aminopeptidase [Chloroflexota bacterium]
MNIRNRSVNVRTLDAGIGVGERTGNGITVKNQRELDRMIEAGRITGLTLLKLRDVIAAGMTTADMDAIAEREIRALGGLPAFKGYRGFPATLCISLNEEIVHGIPGGRVIKDGDIVGLDLGAIVDGMYGDSALTVAVGETKEEIRAQMETGRAALFAGIAQVRAGNRIGDVSAAVQDEIERRGQYGIVREYVGHGIGRQLHEEPSVPNYGAAGRGPLLRPGMAIAIEPMVNLGTHATRVLDDDWTVVTADGKPSVHFEHTVLVTEGDPIVTTKVE